MDLDQSVSQSMVVRWTSGAMGHMAQYMVSLSPVSLPVCSDPGNADAVTVYRIQRANRTINNAKIRAPRAGSCAELWPATVKLLWEGSVVKNTDSPKLVSQIGQLPVE
jgi:hypothetical protein